MNIDELNLMFPNMPKYKSNVQTILVEPIIGSGEKISFFSIAVSDTEFRITPVINEDKLSKLFDTEKSLKSINGILTWIFESITEYVKLHKNTKYWVPPLQGVEITEAKLSLSNNISQAIERDIKYYSCFGDPSLAYNEKYLTHSFVKSGENH